jgi:hypothetical protein
MPAVLRRPVVLAALAVVMAGLAWLAFGWFGVQQLVLDDKVNEAPPVLAEATKPTVLEPTPTTAPAPPPARAEFRSRSHPTRGQAVVLTGTDGQRFLRFEGFKTDNGPDLNVYLSTAGADAPAGDFNDDYVDLGDLKGNIGDQNYAIPAGVDLTKHHTVVIWCVRFSVAFGTAGLA